MSETMSEHWVDSEHFDDESEHLADSERFQKGGRDTVIVVWTLAGVAVVTFLLSVAAVYGF